MMCMAPLRRLPSWGAAGGWRWAGSSSVSSPPAGSGIRPASVLAAGRLPRGAPTAASPGHQVPALPWLAMMMLGWVFGRHLIRFQRGQDPGLRRRRSCGSPARPPSLVFAVVRWHRQGYGDMFLHRADDSWQQWLHVSKYPPSLTYCALELGSCVALPGLPAHDRADASASGRTACSSCSGRPRCSSTSCTGWRSRSRPPTSACAASGDLATTYIVSAVMLVLLYPACRWYRSVQGGASGLVPEVHLAGSAVRLTAVDAVKAPRRPVSHGRLRGHPRRRGHVGHPLAAPLHGVGARFLALDPALHRCRGLMIRFASRRDQRLGAVLCLAGCDCPTRKRRSISPGSPTPRWVTAIWCCRKSGDCSARWRD